MSENPSPRLAERMASYEAAASRVTSAESDYGTLSEEELQRSSARFNPRAFRLVQMTVDLLASAALALQEARRAVIEAAGGEGISLDGISAQYPAFAAVDAEFWEYLGAETEEDVVQAYEDRTRRLQAGA